MEDNLPIPIYPSPLGAFSLFMDAYITGSDTIRITGQGKIPSIVGRVITVKSLRDCIPPSDHVHPYVVEASMSDPVIKLQWYIINDNASIPTRDHFPCCTASIQRACGNKLLEAASTNYFCLGFHPPSFCNFCLPPCLSLHQASIRARSQPDQHLPHPIQCHILP